MTPSRAPGDQSDATGADEVQAELDRVLSSVEFEASDRRRRFLRYLVEETLAGRGERLKGTTIAMDVFGRDETFNSQEDPVVRIEARRLRRDLDSFYIGAGAVHPLRIHIPKGGYAARFDSLAPSSQPSAGGPAPAEHGSGMNASPRRPGTFTSEWFRMRTLGGFALLAGIIAIVVSMAGPGPVAPFSAAATRPSPRLFIQAFGANDGSEISRSISAGLGSELLVDLTKFQGLRLYMLAETSVMPAPGDGPAYLVSGDVLTDGTQASILARLLDAETAEVVWSEAYRVPVTPATLIETRRDISARIATVLGQPYGPLADDLREDHAGSAGSSTESYLCVLRSYSYRRSFTDAAFAEALACLEPAVRRDPDYADAWAMLGWLYMDDGRFDFTGGDTATLYAKGATAAERALALDGDNVTALKALASIRYYTGHYAESEALARRAVALNPYDPDTLAQLGWRLAARGNFDDGISYLEQAIDRSVDPPGWYFHMMIIDRYLAQDYEKMLALAQRATKDGSEFSSAMLGLAYLRLGDEEAARGAVERVPAASSLRSDPDAFFARHGARDALKQEMASALQEAFAVSIQKSGSP
ncbi:tetratricopeptide repeat protein [Palleronia sp. KMU-117]|uniref:tetratricopeptide repeat protein n=1 Tax=Palleronia sp. KMU-117 TaxID=3434108 RepID=UPI003D757DB3